MWEGILDKGFAGASHGRHDKLKKAEVTAVMACVIVARLGTHWEAPAIIGLGRSLVTAVTI